MYRGLGWRAARRQGFKEGLAEAQKERGRGYTGSMGLYVMRQATALNPKP
jgi:hypothetical protein